jgi:hypothetical protein
MATIEIARTKVLAQIDALLLTMTQVRDTNGELSMPYWIEHGVDGVDVVNDTVLPASPEVTHFCGAAACICGYQALANRFNAFPDARRVAYDLGGTKDDIADAMSDSLTYAFHALFGNDELACSIFNGGTPSRLESARLCKVFSNEELEGFTHLHTEAPTPEDVLVYLVACREVVVAYNP